MGIKAAQALQAAAGEHLQGKFYGAAPILDRAFAGFPVEFSGLAAVT
jgi:hypothetical protein